MSYQWLKGVEIFDFVVAEIKVGQLGTVEECGQPGADPVVAELELLELGEFGEPLEGCETDVDETEGLERCVLVRQAFDLCRSGIVQVQLFDLQQVQYYGMKRL